MLSGDEGDISVWLHLCLYVAHSPVIQVLYLLVKFATLLQRPCWHFWAWSTFFSDNLPNCVQLCLRSRMYWISFFTGPGSAIFLGHPSTNSIWSSAVIQQPQNRQQRFSWERPKRSKMSHQMSPKVPGEAGGKLRVAVWAFPESSSSHGAHSAVGHWHALKWLGWSPGITVGCRPPPSGASSLPAEEGAVPWWPQPAPASGARPGPEVCSAVASATACSLCMAASIYTSNWASCAGYGSDVTTTTPAEP